jgi:hypothetical protein
LVVPARDVPEKGAAVAGTGVVQERKTRREQSDRGRGDQIGGAVVGEQVPHRGVVGSEPSGDVHDHLLPAPRWDDAA